jgi:hypothetical protein
MKYGELIGSRRGRFSRGELGRRCAPVSCLGRSGDAIEHRSGGEPSSTVMAGKEALLGKEENGMGGPWALKEKGKKGSDRRARLKARWRARRGGRRAVLQSRGMRRVAQTLGELTRGVKSMGWLLWLQAGCFGPAQNEQSFSHLLKNFQLPQN